MGTLELILLLFIAGICGAVAQGLAGFSRGGCLLSIVVGFIGSLLGTWLARALSFPPVLTVQIGGEAFPIVWSIIGGALFCAVLGLLSGRRPVDA